MNIITFCKMSSFTTRKCAGIFGYCNKILLISFFSQSYTFQKYFSESSNKYKMINILSVNAILVDNFYLR